MGDAKKVLKKAVYLTTLYIVLRKIYDIYTRPAKRKKIRDSVVVITGASKGIGKAYAQMFAREGAKLVLAARNSGPLEELANELRNNFQTEVITVIADVANEGDCIRLTDIALDSFNHIDILINNAGTSTYQYFYKENTENLRKIMDINYWGTIYCTKAVLPSMIKRGKGRIVNISSIAAKKGVPAMANYCATKHAMNGFSEALRTEVKKYGINVNVICPTSTKTELVANSIDNSAFNLDPENYLGMTPERVAKETMNAILDNKREYILGAGEKIIFTINKFIPGALDFIIAKVIPFIMKE